MKRVHIIEGGRKPQNEQMKEKIKKKHPQLFSGNGALPLVFQNTNEGGNPWKTHKCEVFLKVDATAGFHQIQLDKKSLMLTTFNTTFGGYNYLRLPMGICSAPEVFHKTLHQFQEEPSTWTTSFGDRLKDERLKKTLEKLTWF